MKITYRVTTNEGDKRIFSQDSENPLEVVQLHGMDYFEPIPIGTTMSEAEGFIESVLDREGYKFENMTNGQLHPIS